LLNREEARRLDGVDDGDVTRGAVGTARPGGEHDDIAVDRGRRLHDSARIRRHRVAPRASVAARRPRDAPPEVEITARELRTLVAAARLSSDPIRTHRREARVDAVVGIDRAVLARRALRVCREPVDESFQGNRFVAHAEGLHCATKIITVTDVAAATHEHRGNHETQTDCAHRHAANRIKRVSSILVSNGRRFTLKGRLNRKAAKDAAQPRLEFVGNDVGKKNLFAFLGGAAVGSRAVSTTYLVGFGNP
jgi:hypothetical protein